MRSVIYTHKAWFWLCPVYAGGLATDAPDITPRARWLNPVMGAICLLCDAADWLLRRAGRSLKVGLFVTAELDCPMVLQHQVRR